MVEGGESVGGRRGGMVEVVVKMLEEGVEEWWSVGVKMLEEEGKWWRLW